MSEYAPATRADIEDQHWLDSRVAVLGDGIEAAKEIWLNWSDGRCVGRLHPGMTAGDFLASQLGGLRLDVGELVKALPEMSTREIAKVAGVNNATVSRARVAFATPEPAARVVGADGKSYPGRVLRTVEAQVIESPPRGRPTGPARYPTWWREVGMWLSRARPEHARVLRELDDRVHAAMLAGRDESLAAGAGSLAAPQNARSRAQTRQNAR